MIRMHIRALRCLFTGREADVNYPGAPPELIEYPDGPLWGARGVLMLQECGELNHLTGSS